MYIEVAWQTPTSSMLDLSDADLRELDRQGVDLDDQGDVAMAVQRWIKDGRDGWTKTEIEDRWTERDDLELVQVDCYGNPPQWFYDEHPDPDDEGDDESDDEVETPSPVDASSGDSPQ